MILDRDCVTTEDNSFALADVGFSCPFLCLSAPVFPADHRLSDPCRRMSEFWLCWGQWLHQCSQCSRRANGGGLWNDESGVCETGVHSCVLLPWTGPEPPALQRVSQKPLLQWWGMCGHSAWLQVSKNILKTLVNVSEAEFVFIKYTENIITSIRFVNVSLFPLSADLPPKRPCCCNFYFCYLQ